MTGCGNFIQYIPFFIVWLATSQRLLAAFCSTKDNAQESAKDAHSLPAFHVSVRTAEQHWNNLPKHQNGLYTTERSIPQGKDMGSSSRVHHSTGDGTASESFLAPWGKVVPVPTAPGTVLKKSECGFLFGHPQSPHHLHSISPWGIQQESSLTVGFIGVFSMWSTILSPTLHSMIHENRRCSSGAVTWLRTVTAGISFQPSTWQQSSPSLGVCLV